MPIPVTGELSRNLTTSHVQSEQPASTLRALRIVGKPCYINFGYCFESTRRTPKLVERSGDDSKLVH